MVKAVCRNEKLVDGVNGFQELGGVNLSLHYYIVMANGQTPYVLDPQVQAGRSGQTV